MAASTTASTPTLQVTLNSARPLSPSSSLVDESDVEDQGLTLHGRQETVEGDGDSSQGGNTPTSRCAPEETGVRFQPINAGRGQAASAQMTGKMNRTSAAFSRKTDGSRNSGRWPGWP